MKRPFRQPAQAEKNKWNRPSEPGRFFLLPKTQPENDRKRAKRNIKPFNFDQPPFLDDSRVNQPDERGDGRPKRPQTGTRNSDKSERNQKNRNDRRHARGPFDLVPRDLECGSDQPIDQRRLPKVGVTTALRHTIAVVV